MKKVIITGADGFVGSQTVQYFLTQGVEVLAISRGATPKRLLPAKGLTYLPFDISKPQGLLELIQFGTFDTFLHFAWAGASGEARVDYHLQTQNAIDTVECMKVAKKLGCTRFVCAGSIMEYEVMAATHAQGSQPGLGYIYGMAKHLAHCLCKPVAVDIGIELIWPMITNAYGVGELSPRFVNTTLRKIINHNALQFTAATQNYDFVYITDVARAFYLIAKNGKPFYEYIIGSGHAKPLRDYILELKQACAPEVELHFGDIPFTGTNLPLCTFDTQLTREDCGFRAEVSFAQGTQMTLEWLKSTIGSSQT